jgi:alkylated DNA repair protein (DNA oxidative demethylase)
MTSGDAGFPHSLFSPTDVAVRDEEIGPGVTVLRHFAAAAAGDLLAAIQEVLLQAPLRHMVTPGGSTMSVRMSNCGSLGWISDRRGYRYTSRDPLSDNPWPELPAIVRELTCRAAARVGFSGFVADACLVNCYEPGMNLSLHQDRDERDFDAPIVSVSLGIPAMFRFGGPTRSSPVRNIPLGHGDVVVWGGPARLAFHGIRVIKDASHPMTGRLRYNLTVRKAG